MEEIRSIAVSLYGKVVVMKLQLEYLIKQIDDLRGGVTVTKGENVDDRSNS